MKIRKRTLSQLVRVYSITLIPGRTAGELPSLAAGSEGDGPLLVFDPPDYLPRVLAEEPGGFISLIPLTVGGCRYLLGSVDFKPGFRATQCRLVLYELDGAQKTPAINIRSIPFVHRLGYLRTGGQGHVVVSTLCSGKTSREDWSQPGGIYLLQVPDEPSNATTPWKMRSLVTGLNKNHGLDPTTSHPGMAEGFLISAMEGLFLLPVPASTEGPWIMEKVADGEHSDACACDWDGSGLPQVFSLSPFHGNRISMHRKTNGGWHAVLIDDDIEFGHVLWAGNLLGAPGLVVGGRAGDKELRLYRREGEGYRRQRIDGSLAPTQVTIVDGGADFARLFVASQEESAVLLYDIEP